MPKKSTTKDKDTNISELTDATEVNNRFSDVIGKMEAETKKVEEKKSKKAIEKKYEISGKTKETKKSEKKETSQKKQKEQEIQKIEHEEQKIEEIIEKNTNTEKGLTNADINDLIKQKEELDIVKNEIKNLKKLPSAKMKSIYSKIFKNSIFAIIFLLFFCVIVWDYTTLRPESFSTDIKALSIISILTTIILFEIAYKKDSGKLTVRGIEFLLLSISNVLLIYVYNFYRENFVIIALLFGGAFVIYYLIKSFVVYKKDRKTIKKEIIEERKKEEE